MYGGGRKMNWKFSRKGVIISCSVVKTLPSNAEDMGLILDLGRSHLPGSNKAHVPQLLKPACLEPVLHKRSHHRRSLHTATRK